MNNTKNAPIIYGIKKDDKYHYIGKTSYAINDDGELVPHKLSYIQNNINLRNAFKNKEIFIEELKISLPKERWDEKIAEVVQKHKDHHPLLNAQWMKDGKRGYWEGTGGYWLGKEKDQHTLDRLSESKFKKVIQYDLNGKIIKIWNSGKEAAIIVFKDYKVVRGCAESRLYHVVKNKLINNKIAHNSYWFKYEDIKLKFGKIPEQLDINYLIEEQKQLIALLKKNSNHKRITHRVYTVIQYDSNGNVIEIFPNAVAAARHFQTYPITIRRLCKGRIKNEYYLLKYGPKLTQPIMEEEINYEIKPLKQPPRPKKTKEKKIRKPKKKREKTRTTYTILQFNDKGKQIKSFDNIKLAVKKLKIGEATIRRICTGNAKKPKLNLKYGEKKTIIIK